MNELIILFFIIPILIIQLYFFRITGKYIKNYKDYFPPNILDNFSIENIRENLELRNFKSISTILRYSSHKLGKFPLINKIDEKLEEELDINEESIKKTVTLPLYLGLLGTILGVILGLILFNLKEANFEDNVSAFITGIIFSMLASASGLIEMSINWFTYNKIFRSNRETKNGLIEILEEKYISEVGIKDPDFQILVTNLIEFNKTFEKNTNDFKTIFKDVKEVFETQREILDKVEQIDLKNLVEVNTGLVKTLKSSTKEFEKFDDYLKNLNEYLKNSRELINKTNEIYVKLDNFGINAKTIAEEIKNNIKDNREIMNLIREHITAFVERKKMISKILDGIDNYIKEGFDNLSQNLQNYNNRFNTVAGNINQELEGAIQRLIQETNNKIAEYEQVRLQHEEDFVEALNENVRNIGRLEYIEKIYKKLVDDNEIAYLKKLKEILEKLNNDITQFHQNLNGLRLELVTRNSINNEDNPEGI